MIVLIMRTGANCAPAVPPDESRNVTPTTMSEDRKAATNTLILSIVGCACGGLLTNALTSSSTARVVGTVLGAAVPPLIASKGPGHRLRAGLAIGVTASALFVAYGGFALVAAASGTTPVVPLPDRLDPTNPGPAVEVSPSTVDCGTRTVGEPGDSFLCKDVVTVTSTGSGELKVWSVDWVPRGQFAHNQDCVKKSPLSKGESCTVWIYLKSSDGVGHHSAQMIIHENVKTDNGVHVTVNGDLEAPQPVGDVVISPRSLQCAYAANEPGNGEHKPAVKITFTVDLEDPTAEPPTHVTVSAHDVTEMSVERLQDSSGTFTVGQAGTLVIPLAPDNFDQPPAALALSVDGANNTLPIKVALPTQSQPDGPLTCEAT